MLKSVLNVFRTPLPKIEFRKLPRSELSILIGDYAHDGTADNLDLPSDRLSGISCYVHGASTHDAAHDFAFLFNNIISKLRDAIEREHGHNYAKWFTHAVCYFEVDLREADEGISPILRVVYRDRRDQMLGSLILNPIYAEFASEMRDGSPIPGLANCYMRYPYDANPSEPLDDDYRSECARTIASRAEREVRVEAADV
jgi:hypothetical protein